MIAETQAEHGKLLSLLVQALACHTPGEDALIITLRRIVTKILEQSAIFLAIHSQLDELPELVGKTLSTELQKVLASE